MHTALHPGILCCMLPASGNLQWDLLIACKGVPACHAAPPVTRIVCAGIDPLMAEIIEQRVQQQLSNAQ